MTIRLSLVAAKMEYFNNIHVFAAWTLYETDARFFYFEGEWNYANYD